MSLGWNRLFWLLLLGGIWCLCLLCTRRYGRGAFGSLLRNARMLYLPVIGIMLTGMLLGFLLRNKRLSWIHKIITLLIWVLLFLLGIDVGGNEAIIKGLHTLGLEALIITLAAVTGSILCAWGLWYLLYIRNKGKETEV